MRRSEDSDSTGGATRAAAPGMFPAPRTRLGSGGTRLSSPMRPNPLRPAQDDATPKDSAAYDEPRFIHAGESGPVNGWNPQLLTAVLSFACTPVDAQVSGGRGAAAGHPVIATAIGGGCISLLLWILTMAAVVALTDRLIPARGSADKALHFPSQGMSPVITAPPSVALAPVASPGSPLARVMISAPCHPGPGGTTVTAASAAPAPCVLLMIVT